MTPSVIEEGLWLVVDILAKKGGCNPPAGLEAPSVIEVCVAR
jgi:hypothetical protein